MKTFTSLLIGCSLALAGAAWAQQPEEQPSPKGKKGAAEKTTHGAQATPGANAARQPGATTEPGAPAGKGRKTRAGQETATGAQTGTNVSGQPAGTPTTEPAAGKGRKARAETNVSGQPAASATPGAKHEKGMKGRAAKTSATPAAPAAAAVSATPATAATAATTRATPATAATQTAAQPGTAATTKKVEPQKVQQVKAQAAQIKQQHATFRAQPKPAQVPAVTFQQNYRIQGAEQWQGSQYEVFRSYHPERHDQFWYRSRYPRVELIGGGYYYWNSGYWYPAWGYDPAAEYYAYDAPIYVGHSAEPPDRVIADVQAELQQMGYYQGEVDGLLGPLTREALAAYQADQGLTATAMIDQPTLDSLGLA